MKIVIEKIVADVFEDIKSEGNPCNLIKCNFRRKKL